MKIALLRVGIDTGCGGILSPLFDDKTFEFIQIPQYKAKGIIEKRTYGNQMGRSNKLLIKYFRSGANVNRHVNCPIHVDPEFATFTYGDPSFTKKGLGLLSEGDYLILYAGLQSVSNPNKCAIYAVAYFEIVRSVIVKDLKERHTLLKDFKNNFHVMHKYIFNRDVSTAKNHGLKLVKGSNRSKLFKKAYRISNYKNEKGKYILSNEMKRVLGNLSPKNDLTRNSLRWVDDKSIEKTVKWLSTLK